MQLSVISPTFNEAQNVGTLVQRVEGALGSFDYEIIIVDDDSPDLTWSVVDGISARDPRVRVLRRTSNPGLGAAVIDGFSAARGDAVACIDADLQHDPDILPRMFEELVRGSSVVIGSRYVDGGGTEGWSVLRRIVSLIATKMAQVLLGVTLKDPMSGYFLMRRDDFLRVRRELDGKGFKILLEILATLRAPQVTEVPYTFRPRSAGESKLSGRVAFHYLEQLWRLSKVGRLRSSRFLRF